MEKRLSYFTHDNAGIEAREGLPTVLNGKITERGEPPEVKPQLTILADKNEEIISNMMKITFISPYQRYLKVLPYSIQQEKQELEKQKIKDAKEAEKQNKQQNLDGKQQDRIGGEVSEVKEDRFAGELPTKKVKTEASVDALLSSVKEEVEEEKKKRKGKNKKFTSRKKLKNEEPPQDFTPYDYNQVDFNKFHSRNQPNRIAIPNSNKKNKQFKRKQQFQGKSQPKKRKGQWW